MAKSGIPGIRAMKGKWQYRFMVDGRRYSETTAYVAVKRNLGAAAAKMAEHKRQVLLGRPTAAEVLFTEAAERFIEWSKLEHAAKPNTWRRHKTSMVSLTAFFAKRKIGGVTAGDMESYKTARRETDIAEVTIRHDLHAASQLFQFARKQGWLEHDPLEGVAIPSDQESRNETVLTLEMERLYLEHAGTRPVLHDFTIISLEQGMRPDEVLSVLKDDVDIAVRTLRVRTGKSRAARRVIHLTEASLRVLGRRMESDSIWVFPGKRRGTHATYSGLINMHNAVLAETGLEFTPYSFRHTFATRLYERTRDIATVAKILGHADLKTVMRYVHIEDDRAKQAMLEFEAGKAKSLEVVQ